MNEYRKQAYLIIAHKDDLVFRTLLKLLDDSRNDIFIHMDLKNVNYDEQGPFERRRQLAFNNRHGA